MTLFDEQFENEAIERIVKFGKIAYAMGFEVVVGFSGGKDSQVVYDLCKRSGIKFKACFNHAFESCVTMNFIKQHYPEVEWRREVKEGFIQNIWKNHNSLLPTVQFSYCCEDYKHNPKFVDNASIVGVRRQESQKRKQRKVFEATNKTFVKKNKDLFSEYFEDKCTGIGTPGKIQLKPIVDWTDEDVWHYIRKHGLPINPEYTHTHTRVGCVVCPKADFNRNYEYLIKHPKIIDAFIMAREKRPDIDWLITSDNKDYSENKAEYICRWLNHSFMPFTKRQRKYCDLVLNAYYKIKNKGENSRSNGFFQQRR